MWIYQYKFIDCHFKIRWRVTFNSGFRHLLIMWKVIQILTEKSDFKYQGAVSLKLLGGKLAPKNGILCTEKTPKTLVKWHPGVENHCKIGCRLTLSVKMYIAYELHVY